MKTVKKLRKLNDEIKMPKRLVIDDTSRIQKSNMELCKKNSPGIVTGSRTVNSSFFYKTVIGTVVIPTSDVSATIIKNLKHVTKW